jgi:hypothetical protein
MMLKLLHSEEYFFCSIIKGLNVKFVLLYGCETWKNSKSVTAKLQVFINKCLRKILRIFWPNQIMNSELWKRTNNQE